MCVYRGQGLRYLFQNSHAPEVQEDIFDGMGEHKES